MTPAGHTNLVGAARFDRFERPVRLRSWLWGLTYAFLFRPTPVSMHGWRRFLLRRFGAAIGRGVGIHPSVRITYPWNLSIGAGSRLEREVILESMGPITIGSHVLVSQYAHICAGDHDYADPAMDIKPAGIEIGDRVWIAADAFVGPNARIGRGSMIAARSSVFGELPPGMVCVGEPASPRRPRPYPPDETPAPLRPVP
jgi:putative colanic acid biosynthesis acetyltransferase WcaF